VIYEPLTESAFSLCVANDSIRTAISKHSFDAE